MSDRNALESVGGPRCLRNVLGRFATGVVAVAALDPRTGRRAGFAASERLLQFEERVAGRCLVGVRASGEERADAFGQCAHACDSTTTGSPNSFNTERIRSRVAGCGGTIGNR